MEASTSEPPRSDWLPLVTLVRLPTLTQLQCPTDVTQPCTLGGSSLFLIDSVSVDPAFANPVAVPDGYTGVTLALPHPAASTVFLRLRDDPASVDPVVLPGATPAAAIPAPHGRSAGRAKSSS